MQLFKHQQDIINDDPKKCLIAFGTGGGKTLTALSLAKGKTLVICPKTTSMDGTWTKYAIYGNRVHVISKETFRRDWDTVEKCDTIIIDEAHTVCGVTPTIRYRNKKPEPKTSQLFDACLSYVKKHAPERLYLLTATPVRNPLAVFALGVLLGKWDLHSDFYKFRGIYYIPVKMGMREIWIPNKDTLTKERLGKSVQRLGYTGKLEDWVDVPEQTHKVISVPLTADQTKKIKELPIDFPDPLVLVGKKHQVEQGVLKGNEYEDSVFFNTEKLGAIRDLIEEFPKILIFAKYTQQIDMLANYAMELDIPVFILTGDTKDRGAVIEEAESASRCVVIAQSSVSAGYELPSFRCTVFASMSYSYVDYAQALGRTLRINNLQKNLYVYLLSGDIDKAVYKAIENKGDFNEAIYAKVI